MPTAHKKGSAVTKSSPKPKAKDLRVLRVRTKIKGLRPKPHTLTHPSLLSPMQNQSHHVEAKAALRRPQLSANTLMAFPRRPLLKSKQENTSIIQPTSLRTNLHLNKQGQVRTISQHISRARLTGHATQLTLHAENCFLIAQDAMSIQHLQSQNVVHQRRLKLGARQKERQ